MVDHVRPTTASAGAIGVCRLRQECFAFTAPFRIVAARRCVRTLAVEPGFALPRVLRRHRTRLTAEVKRAAMAADVGSARGHQAGGFAAGTVSGRTTQRPAMKAFPPFPPGVTVTRTYRFGPT